MKYVRQRLAVFCSMVFLCVMLCSCGGDSPWRYNPGPPDRPAGLAATADNGRVALAWPAARNAAAYNIYYGTSPVVTAANSIKIANIVSTSYIQTGLANDTTYYFAITSVNSGSESGESGVVSATPALPGPFVQEDLAGTWNFNALVSGTGAGWLRGKLTIDSTGAVTFGSYLDSAGNVAPPAGLFPQLLLNPGGHVRDANVGIARFQGDLSLNRALIVGSSAYNGASHLTAILMKQAPGAVFTNAGDIQGFGNSGGGGRRFIYNQLASGAGQEWEFASGQIGKDQKVQYTSLIAPSNPVKPADKASIMNVGADGMVTESLTAVLPRPATVIDSGIMSADKSVIVGTATDTSGTAPRYVLRIYQLVNIIFSDPNTFVPADLAGGYVFQKLSAGATPLSASGDLSISAAGIAAVTSYADSSGSAIPPGDFTLDMDGNGVVTNAGDPSILGKLSHFKDLLVFTGTGAQGIYNLTVALKR